MSINRVDFQGTIVRTGDYTQVKQNEDNKGMVDQSAFQVQSNRENEQKRTTVIQKDDADPQQQKFDAKEKGSNEYHKQEGRRKSAKELEELEKLADGVIDKHGRPVNLGFSSGFDFTV
ncbi:MAG: hypothetical protein IJT34_05025 [Butyrivibrio sp.]|nr:hypothetical protein [Butyrivibrio sp.]